MEKEKDKYQSQIDDLRRQLAEKEDELKANQATIRRFELALESGNDSIWDWNMKTGEAFFSPGYYRLLGYIPQEFEASFSAWKSLMHQDDLPGVIAKIEDCISSKTFAAKIVFRARCKDGSYKLISGHGKVVEFNSKGIPLRMCGVITDAAETVNEQKSQDRTKHLNDTVLENCKDWIFVKDANSRFELVNRALCNDLRVKAEDLIGRSEYEFFDGETVEELQKIDERVLQGEKVETELKKRFHNSSHYYHCIRVPVYSEDRKVVGICVFSRDITQQKKFEDDYKNLFQKMLDGFAIHQIICDEYGHPEDYRYIDVNPAFESITGLKRDAVIGKTVKQVFPETEHEWIERFGKVALTGKPDHFVNFSIALNKHFEVTAFRTSPGQFACIFKDITDQKKIEDDRDKIQAQLLHSQKMESVGRLAGGVAHDFNNLIGVIMGCAEMAMLKYKRGADIDSELDGIFKTAERSADLTKQLLTFARRQPVSPKIIALNDTLNGMTSMLKRIIGEEIELVFKPSSGLWVIKFDEGQIHQILTNLCVNAKDAMSGKGKIVVATENHEFDEFSCIGNPGLNPGQYVALTVSDNGSGIDAETLSHIFEPFYTTKGRGKGTGLGLATVYGIVKQNEGYVKVFSQPGEGTTFRIFIPRAEGEVLKKAAPVEVKRHELAETRTILVVEDDETILSLTRRILESFGYKVLISTRPENAIALAKRQGLKLDLLITDVVMPEMNGKELSKRILEIFPEVRIIFISGYTAEIISTHGVKQDSNFLQKPFHMQALSEMVKSVFKQIE